MDAQKNSSASSASSTTFNRSKAFQYFFTGVALLVLCAVLYWWFFSRQYEDTDDAYVVAPQAQITAQVDGILSAVEISETQSVSPGELLFKIDPTEAKIASAMADAELLKAFLSVRSSILFAQQRKQELEKVRSDYQRRQNLSGLAAVSAEELEHMRLEFTAAEVAYRQALEAANHLTQVNDAMNHPEVLKAIEADRQAFVNLLRTEVRAPLSAIVAKRNAQVGQRVGPGTPLAILVMQDAMWVDANFKEDQLGKIRVGQTAKLEADIYGNKVVYSGKVLGFSPGTGSTLSLLPAQNATGNWVKVVQRLPVRIALDARELQKHPLHMGLTMSVSINTSTQTGSALDAMHVSTPIRTDIYATQLVDAGSHIEKLLRRAVQR